MNGFSDMHAVQPAINGFNPSSQPMQNGSPAMNGYHHPSQHMQSDSPAMNGHHQSSQHMQNGSFSHAAPAPPANAYDDGEDEGIDLAK